MAEKIVLVISPLKFYVSGLNTDRATAYSSKYMPKTRIVGITRTLNPPHPRYRDRACDGGRASDKARQEDSTGFGLGRVVWPTYSKFIDGKNVESIHVIYDDFRFTIIVFR